jgi:hypothetical protein
MGRKKGIPGVSVSWKRAVGISSAKAKLSRQIGIPLTRSGRQRKFGAAMGCCIPAALLVVAFGSIALGVKGLAQILFA